MVFNFKFFLIYFQ